MNQVKEFINRACNGFQREKYTENNLPSNFQDFVALPFFGDKRHEFILASVLLEKLKEKYKKYFILVGYQNHSGFFPIVDEFWSVKKIQHGSGWGNNRMFEKQLSRYFDVIYPEELEKYYCNGFTKKFFEEFKSLTYTLPEQPSIKPQLAERLASKGGNRIFLYPSMKVNSWNRGIKSINCQMEFWEKLLERLLENGFLPIVYRDDGAYDLSAKFADKCVFVENEKILDLFGIMRASGCVLDVFSDISRWSIAARTPFVCVAERNVYNETRDYEIDDLFTSKIPYKYIFEFTTTLEHGGYVDIVDMILSKVEKFLPEINWDKLPHTSKVYTSVPYNIRLPKITKLIRGL
jgi:hypothetical protein